MIEAMVNKAFEEGAKQGKTPLDYHVTQWNEEVEEYSLADNLFMATVALAIIQRELRS